MTFEPKWNQPIIFFHTVSFAEFFQILRFLNFAPWSFNNGPIFRSVLELLLPRIEQLTDQELVDMLSVREAFDKIILFKFYWFHFVPMQMYQVHFEPGAVVAPIVRLAEKRILEQSSATNNYNYHNVPLLYCCSMTEIPEKNNRIINCLDAYLDTMPTDIVNDSLLFQMLRRNKQSARNVYDKYWSKVATELAAMDPKRTPNFDNMLSKACYRYCYFDNSQRGQYRHLPFEEIATKLVIDEINTGISGMIPRKFVKLATFLLGFGSHQTTHRFPENFVQRVEDMVRQYTVHDILQLSRGVELFYTRGNCKRWDMLIAFNSMSSFEISIFCFTVQNRWEVGWMTTRTIKCVASKICWMCTLNAT